MPAATGGFRAQAVDIVTNRGDRSCLSIAPVSVATLGIAAGVVNSFPLVVAQKHLCDINVRLDQIETGKVVNCETCSTLDLVAEMREMPSTS